MLTSLPNKESIHSTCLSERLLALASLVPKDCVVCDVGSDHGALPLYLLKTGRCKKAIVTDLNPLPLERAKRALASEILSSQAEFLLTDGIADVVSSAPDIFVIAGMGGETIAGILDRAISDIPKGTRFALQPMSKDVYLRRYLYEHGFFVDFETVVLENNKIFLVFSATYDGTTRTKDDFFYKFGEYLPKNSTETANRYWKMRLEKVRNVCSGKRVAGFDVSEEEREERFLLTLLEEKDENL